MEKMQRSLLLKISKSQRKVNDFLQSILGTGKNLLDSIYHHGIHKLSGGNITDDDEKKGVHIITEQGAAMMTVEGIGREGDLVSVQGALLGSWATKMYVAPEDIPKMIGYLLNWQLVGYILSLPFILGRRRKAKKEQ